MTVDACTHVHNSHSLELEGRGIHACGDSHLLRFPGVPGQRPHCSVHTTAWWGNEDHMSVHGQAPLDVSGCDSGNNHRLHTVGACASRVPSHALDTRVRIFLLCPGRAISEAPHQ
jgi:hypothetical protein